MHRCIKARSASSDKHEGEWDTSSRAIGATRDAPAATPGTVMKMKLKRTLTIVTTTLVLAAACLPTIALAQDDIDIAAIRAAIRRAGANWTAGENVVTRRGANYMAALAAAPVPVVHSTDRFFTPDMSLALPTAIDWRNRNGNFVTPVRDQGSCGSCWAFAAVAAVEARDAVFNGIASPTTDLSEQQVLSCSGAGDCVAGGYLSGALDYIEATGTPDESCFAYAGYKKACTSTCGDWASRTVTIDDWSWVTTTNYTDTTLIKTALMDGPVPVWYKIYMDFYAYTGGVYQHVWGNYVGNHFVLIVGYNDAEQAWIVKNSWGSDWGTSGYFKIKYGDSEFGSWAAAVTPQVDSCALPTLDFSANPTSGPPGTVVYFTESGNKPQCPVTARKWIFGDGTFTSHHNPLHVYNAVGNFTVKYEVTNSAGTFRVEKPALISIADNAECHVNADCEDGIGCTVNTCNPQTLTCQTVNNCGDRTLEPACANSAGSGEYTLPIEISDGSNVDAYNFNLDFDNTHLQFKQMSTSGTLLEGRGAFMACGMEGNGDLGCSGNPYPALPPGSSGVLMNLVFTVLSDAGAAEFRAYNLGGDFGGMTGGTCTASILLTAADDDSDDDAADDDTTDDDVTDDDADDDDTWYPDDDADDDTDDDASDDDATADDDDGMWWDDDDEPDDDMSPDTNPSGDDDSAADVDSDEQQQVACGC